MTMANLAQIPVSNVYAPTPPFAFQPENLAKLDLYKRYGWSWAYWAFREWDVMNIERTAEPADKVNHLDAPLLRLFKSYFAKDKVFLTER